MGCSEEQQNQSIAQPINTEVNQMAKALFVIAPNKFKDEEYFTPKRILEDNGIEVTTASLSEQAISVGGETVDVDVLLNKTTTDYDAIVFVGGSGASIYFNNEKAHGLARKFNSLGKIVAAICIAPSTLANAGILDGKQVTSFPSEQDNLESKGATYTGDDVTVDGNIITANGPGAADEFGEKLVEKLSG